VVRDLHYHSRLGQYAKIGKAFFSRVGKDTALSDLRVELVGMSRDIVYDFEGEGHADPPLADEEWDARDLSKVNVVRTGIKAIDRAAGGGHGRGELLVWGGGTSHGKSFAAQRLLRLQAQLGQRALYISCEDPKELMMCRMLADYCSPSQSPKDIRMRAADPEVVEDALARMRAELSDKITVVEHKKPTVDQVCNSIRYYRYARNIDMVIVDYLQAVNDDNSVGQKVMDTANVISKLKKCFTECKVAGVVMTQYARNEYREGEEPSINAAKYAGDIENEAEILAFMWRDAEDNLKVKLPKVKWSSAKQLRYIIPVNPVTGCHQDWQEDFDQ
jgi:replicative DNA helicase